MARNRMIRPEFWEDSKMAKLSPFARLFFIAMWNFADDEGFLPCDLLWLKAKCMPYDSVSIQSLVDELLALERIEINNAIIKIKNFLKYQRIMHPTESELKEKFNTPHEQYDNPHEDSIQTSDKIIEVKLSEVKLSETEVEVKTHEKKTESQPQPSALSSQSQDLANNKAKIENLISGCLKGKSIV